MDSLEETSKVSSKMTFFKYVFNFDEDSKNDMMNIVQYAVLAIIPIIVLNKTMQKYVPEADEEKGSAEILAEVTALSAILVSVTELVPSFVESTTLSFKPFPVTFVRGI
jgi:hypothetical protein